MDNFLQQATEQGRPDSSGVFTIDLAKARSKLGRYQLASFREFPQFLLSAAVAGGARELSFQIEVSGPDRSRQTRVTFEGWSLSGEELTNLLFGELAAPELKAHKYLAMVLSAITSKEPVVLTCGEHAYLVNKDKVDRLKGPQGGGRQEWVQLAISCNWNYELFTTPTLKSSWLPIKVTRDGEKLNGYVNSTVFRSQFVQGYWTKGPDSPDVANLHGEAKVVSPGPSEHSSLILLGVQGKPQFKLVSDGMAFDLPDSLTIPGIAGFLVVPDLKTDLSFQNLVQNEELEATGQKLRSLAASALRRCAAEKAPLEQSRGMWLLALVESLRGDFELETVETGLLRRIGRLAPTTNPEELEAIANRLRKSTRSEQEGIVLCFWDHARQLWKQWQDRRSSEFMRSCAKLKTELKLHGGQESTLAGLLELYDSNNCVPVAGHAWEPYFASLSRWIVSGSTSEMVNISAHPTWLLPLHTFDLLAGRTVNWGDIYTDGVPPWLLLWDCLERADLSGAQNVLGSAPELEYASRSLEWLELLWNSMKGRISWVRTVQLRAALSLAQFSGPRSSPRLTERGKRDRYRQFSARQGNWCQFASLLWEIRSDKTYYDRASRMLWQKVMLDLAVASEFANLRGGVAWREPVRLALGAERGC